MFLTEETKFDYDREIILNVTTRNECLAWIESLKKLIPLPRTERKLFSQICEPRKIYNEAFVL